MLPSPTMSDNANLLHINQFDRIYHYCKINWGEIYSYELVYDTNEAGAAIVAVRELQMPRNQALIKMPPCFGLDAAWDKLEQFLREKADCLSAMRSENAKNRSQLEYAEHQAARGGTRDQGTRFNSATYHQHVPYSAERDDIQNQESRFSSALYTYDAQNQAERYHSHGQESQFTSDTYTQMDMKRQRLG